MRATLAATPVAPLGAYRYQPAAAILRLPPCKPSDYVPRLRVYAGRGAAALMGTRPEVSGGERARTPQRTEAAHERLAQVLTVPELRREVAGNLRRLFEYREMFGDDFVGRQCWVCIRLLGGLAAEF